MENVINGGKTCHLAISATFLASLREHLGFSRAEETGCSRELVFFRQLASYFIILRSPPRLRELCFIPLASNLQAVKVTAIQKSLSTGRRGELQISISQEFRKYWPFWKGIPITWRDYIKIFYHALTKANICATFEPNRWFELYRLLPDFLKDTLLKAGNANET